MLLFLDSAILSEIEHGLSCWDIDGLTTNPRHVKNSGKPFRTVLAQIAELFQGTNKPVSVEVNPHLTDHQDIVREGLQLHRLSENFVIKVGASEEGFRAIRELSKEGVPTNATLIFSVTQAWHAARAGATYISPFLGWKESHGDSITDFISQTRTMLDRFGYGSKIIAAAIRNARQISDAAVAGAHCVTAGAAVYTESFCNPYSDFGESVFREAWDATPTE